MRIKSGNNSFLLALSEVGAIKKSYYLKVRKGLFKLREESGQLVLEYILILVLSVAIAFLLVSLTNFSGGPVIGWWKKALLFIGNDLST